VTLRGAGPSVARAIASIEAQSRLGPLRVEPSIDVDTTTMVDVAALAKAIREIA
jgi:hypothetical protein